MKPAQLELITTLSAPTLSPDGRRAVIAAQRPSFASDSYVGQLWEVDVTDAQPPRRITAGSLDTAPQFSPDGKLIGFLRRDAKGRSQIAIVDALGAEARLLTNAPLGVTGFTWSRDSDRIAFTAPMPQKGRYGTLDGVDPAKEDPRRIKENKHKMNGRGYTRDQPIGIFVLRVPALDEDPFVAPTGRAAVTAPKQVANEWVLGGTAGVPAAVLVSPRGEDAADPEFSPDGKWLYFAAQIHKGSDDDLCDMVYRVRLGGAAAAGAEAPTALQVKNHKPLAPELIAGGEGRSYSHPRFSNDGATLFMLGADYGPNGLDFVAKQSGIFATSGKVSKRPIRPRHLTDRDTTDYVSALVPYGSSDIAAIARVRGAGELHGVSPAGATNVLVTGQRVVTGAAAAGSTLVVSYSDPTTPGDVGKVEFVKGNGVIRSLSTFAKKLTRETNVVMPRELTVKSKGKHKVHGWVFMPAGEGPHPVLLNIHGGPFAEYNWAWFDEAQVYVEAGYAVVQCNPRGSASYGREHGLAIQGQMGKLDFADVIAFLEGALKSESTLDSKRVGILGGSYGGYLTAWTIAHDHRFKAAVVERGYLDPASFIGTSDIGWFFSEGYTGTDPAKTAAQSPYAFVHQVKTPALVLHSELDWRCPIEQAQRYYAALKRTGTPTEMLVFPGENHELSRSGTPWHRRQRFEAILDWFGRYLPVAAAGQ